MILLATTPITVTRRTATDLTDPYDAVDDSDSSEPQVIASGVRAHIGSPSGAEIVAGGSQEITTLQLLCDPIDLRHGDTVEDEKTGERYRAEWVQGRMDGIGLDHTKARMKRVRGIVSRPTVAA